MITRYAFQSAIQDPRGPVGPVYADWTAAPVRVQRFTSPEDAPAYLPSGLSPLMELAEALGLLDAVEAA